jgi:FecR protein
MINLRSLGSIGLRRQSTRVAFTQRWVLTTFASSLVLATAQAMAGDVKLPPGQRALEVTQVRGKVTTKTPQSRAAQVGERLTVGQRLMTGPRSSALLTLDNQQGVVKVAENTDFTIRQLGIAASGGRITLLSVNKGQIALQVRRFTNPESRLEIRTPSGIAGVRGTQFGVGVSASGRTAILTTEGTVAASAQAQTVLVGAGYASLIYPGEPPTPARPTVENFQIKIKTAQAYRSGFLRVVGQVDPINEVFYQDHSIEVARDGTFQLEGLAQQSNRVSLRVRSPLGNERVQTVWLR